MNDMMLQVKPEGNGVFKGDVIRTLKAICEHRQPPQAKRASA
jgi:hypothetical protein